MEYLGIGIGGLLGLAFIGILVYYVRKGIGAERDSEALSAQSQTQVAAIEDQERLLADKEREDRREEAAAVSGISRDDANKRLRDALSDEIN